MGFRRARTLRRSSRADASPYEVIADPGRLQLLDLAVLDARP
jgi:hypothetical protein